MERSERRAANYTRALAEVVIESLEGIANERQAHFRSLLHHRRPALLSSLHPEEGCIVSLVNFVGWEVCGVDVRCESGFERRPNSTKAIKLNTAEEDVVFDVLGTASAESILRVADQATGFCQFTSHGVFLG
jgi:hypothetical protein